MNFEQEYNIALEQARKELKTCGDLDCDTARLIFRLFPQLHESEDERTRKELIVELQSWEGIPESKRKQYLAYLEKQKEQPQEELVYRLNGLMQEYIKEGKDDAEKEHRFKCYKLFWDALEDANFFEQKEQKPFWNPTEEDVVLFNRAVTTNITLTPQERAKLDIIRMKFKHCPYIKQQKEQKPWKVGENAYFTPDKETPIAEQKLVEGDNETEIQRVFREGKSAGRKEVFYHPEEYGLQKPAEWDAKDKMFIKDCAGILDEAGYTRSSQKLLSMFPIKSTEWREDWREEDIQTRFAFYTYKDEDGVLYLSNVFVEEASRNHGFGTRILRAAEKVAETIGATTISLKVKQDSPANAWYRKNGYGYVAFEDGYDWLEKNLKYMKPNKQKWSEEKKEIIEKVISLIKQVQDDEDWHLGKWSDDAIDLLESLLHQPKQEWSEEDEAMLEDIIDDYDNGEIMGDAVGKVMWLKSLHPSWKPSDEQMKALQNAVALIACDKELARLYNQLKKLM